MAKVRRGATPSPPTTLRQLAKLAGVSAMAVSMALRNHPRVSAKTRTRIQTLARTHGYAPDPALNKLMLHLRARRTRRLLRGAICALFGTEWIGNKAHYAQMIMDGARARAQELGFAFDVLPLEETTRTPGRLRRILRGRGTDGILLPPAPQTSALPADLGWEDFSVVAATYSVVKPEFHRVVPNQFANARLLCRELIERGYTRIGLALEASYAARVNHHCSAAIAWQIMFGGAEFVPPLIVDSPDERATMQWVKTAKPDVIIVSENLRAVELTQWLQRARQARIPVVTASWVTEQRYAGIDERAPDIGIKAIDVLAGMILRGEKGIPAITTVTMLDGRWQPGDLIRRRTARRRRPV